MPPSRTLRSKKKQTRLAFQPLASSSPTKEIYSEAIQDRLANVRYEGARKTRLRAGHADEDERSLPTPQPTSPVATHAQFLKTSSPLSSLRTSPALPPRFANDAYDSSSSEDEIIVPSSKRRRLSDSRPIFDMGNTISASSHKSVSHATTPPLHRSSNSANVTSPTPARRSSRLGDTAFSPSYSDSTSSSQRVLSVDIPTPTKKVSDIGSAETSDDDVMVTKPSTRRGTMRQRSTHSFIVKDNDVQSISSGGDVVASKPSKRQRNQDDFIVDNDEVEYITSDESIHGPSPLKSRKLSRQIDPSGSKQRSRKRAERELEELAEDLVDLQDSEQERSARNSRTRGGPVTTQRDKTKEHFEKLKRRRAGEKAARVVISEDDEIDPNEDGVDLDNIGHDRNRIEISDDSEIPVEEVDPEDEPRYLDAGEEEDDFVVDDSAITTDRLGRPNTDLPLEFTSYASAKPRELFPHIIEWMVKNKISPAFGRHDELYNLSFSRLDDQVKAQAGSRLISSAWNATFKYAILARPSIKVAALPGLDEDLIRTCDACNKSNHPARYDFKFAGKAYSRDTLEPIDDYDEEDEQEDEGETQPSRVSRDEQGHVLASENMHFYLGRFCAANAEMGHKLMHWKHHLNTQVLSYLEEQGVLSAEAIVNREKLSKKKREREAESIVDMMDETGMMAELWQSFQDDLEDARIGMEGHERKGGRSKGRIGSVRVQRDNGAIGEWVDGGKFRQVATRLESDSEGE